MPVELAAVAVYDTVSAAWHLADVAPETKTGATTFGVIVMLVVNLVIAHPADAAIV